MRQAPEHANRSSSVLGRRSRASPRVLGRSVTTFTLIGAAALLIVTAGCGRSARTEGTTTTYPFKGVVVATHPDGALSVTNENIPGFMAPMTMEYGVKNSVGLAALRVGSTIQADLIVASGAGGYWLEHVKVVTAR